MRLNDCKEARTEARRAAVDSKFETRRAATDAQLAERHAGFDLAAQDITPKYHRPQFAVVGEGSHEANTAYAKGYELIDWSK
jgi:hypothetical protein